MNSLTNQRQNPRCYEDDVLSLLGAGREEQPPPPVCYRWAALRFGTDGMEGMVTVDIVIYQQQFVGFVCFSSSLSINQW